MKRELSFELEMSLVRHCLMPALLEVDQQTSNHDSNRSDRNSNRHSRERFRHIYTKEWCFWSLIAIHCRNQ